MRTESDPIGSKSLPADVCCGVPVRILLLERGILIQEQIDVILNAHNMTKPGVPGKN